MKTTWLVFALDHTAASVWVVKRITVTPPVLWVARTAWRQSNLWPARHEQTIDQGPTERDVREDTDPEPTGGPSCSSGRNTLNGDLP
jgi:hypothetical protein